MAAAVPFLKVVGGVLAAKTAIDGLKEGNLGKAVLGGVGAYFSFAGLGATAGASGTATTAGQAAGAPGVATGATPGAVGGSFYGAAAPEIAANTVAGATPAAFGAQTGSLAAATPINAGVQAGAAGGALSGAAMGATSASVAPTAGSTGLLSAPSELGTLGQTGAGTPGGGMLSTDAALTNAGATPVEETVKSFQQGGFDLGSLSDVKAWAEANPDLAAATMQVGGQMLAGYATGEQRARELQRILNEQARERSSRGAIADVNYDLR